jgi:hypothetical protein
MQSRALRGDGHTKYAAIGPAILLPGSFVYKLQARPSLPEPQRSAAQLAAHWQTAIQCATVECGATVMRCQPRTAAFESRAWIASASALPTLSSAVQSAIVETLLIN